MPETNTGESLQYPDVGRAMGETIKKLEQKNAELKGRLLVRLGQGSDKLLFFPNPIKPVDWEYNKIRWEFLMVTGKGFYIARIFDIALVDVVESAVRHPRKTLGEAKKENVRLGYVGLENGGFSLVLSPNVEFGNPSKINGSLFHNMLMIAEPRQVENIVALNKDRALTDYLSPNGWSLLSAQKVDKLLK